MPLSGIGQVAKNHGRTEEYQAKVKKERENQIDRDLVSLIENYALLLREPPKVSLPDYLPQDHVLEPATSSFFKTLYSSLFSSGEIRDQSQQLSSVASDATEAYSNYPDEIYYHILKHLPTENLILFRSTNSTFQRVISEILIDRFNEKRQNGELLFDKKGFNALIDKQNDQVQFVLSAIDPNSGYSNIKRCLSALSHERLKHLTASDFAGFLVRKTLLEYINYYIFFYHTYNFQSSQSYLNLYGYSLTALPEQLFLNPAHFRYMYHDTFNLFLSNNKLETLPQPVANLCQMQQLCLNDNLFNTIPESILALTRLVCLDLNNNQIAEIPRNISHLTRLEVVKLQNNNLTEIPDEMALLSSLKSLHLDGNCLTEQSIPKQCQTKLYTEGYTRYRNEKESRRLHEIAVENATKNIISLGEQTTLPAVLHRQRKYIPK